VAIEIAASRRGLRNLYNRLPVEVQGLFGEMPALLDGNLSLDIVLAYVFFRVEQGQHVTLYCGARKLHKTESDLTWQALDGHHMTRDEFRNLFKTIYGFPIGADALDCITKAETIRDRVMHGKRVGEPDKREAVCRVLQYPAMMNELIADTKGLGFRPFSGNLRGIVGRLEHLDKSTTRWILKGMGLTLG
jgi:hypothetical protein